MAGRKNKDAPGKMDPNEAEKQKDTRWNGAVTVGLLANDDSFIIFREKMNRSSFVLVIVAIEAAAEFLRRTQAL